MYLCKYLFLLLLLGNSIEASFLKPKTDVPLPLNIAPDTSGAKASVTPVFSSRELTLFNVRHVEELKMLLHNALDPREFLKTNDKGNTPLHTYALNKNSKEAVQVLSMALDWLYSQKVTGKIDNETLQCILTARDGYGSTFLHKISNEQVLHSVLTILQNPELFLSVDNEYNTPLHRYALSNNVRLLPTALRWLEQNAGVLLNQILTVKDKQYRDTFLHKIKDANVLNAVLTILQNPGLFLEQDYYGNNPLHMYISNNDPHLAIELSSTALGWLQHYAPLGLLAEILQQKNVSGQTLLEIVTARRFIHLEQQIMELIGHIVEWIGYIEADIASHKVTPKISSPKMELGKSQLASRRRPGIKSTITSSSVKNIPKDKTEQLIEAIKTVDVNVVKQLLDQGIDANIKNKDNVTPLMIAAQLGNIEIVNKLLDKGVNPNIVNNQGATALILAITNKHEKVLQALLKKADPNIQNQEGTTALMIATQLNEDKMIKILLDAHADPTIKNNQGVTALQIAVKQDKEEIVEHLLKEQQIDNDDIRNALDIALEKKYENIVQLLQKDLQNSIMFPKNLSAQDWSTGMDWSEST